MAANDVFAPRPPVGAIPPGPGPTSDEPTIEIRGPNGDAFDIPVSKLNGVKLPEGYGPVHDDPPPGMGDVQSADRQTGKPNSWLQDAMTAFAHGIGSSRVTKYLVPQEEIGELDQMYREAQRDHPTTAKIGNFAGSTMTPEEAVIGSLSNGIIKAGLQGKAVQSAAEKLGVTPWLAKNAGAAKLKWNSNAIKDAVSFGQAAKDTVPGVGAGVGAAIGHAIPGSPITAEFGAIAGDAAGRAITGMPPLARGGFWHNTAQPWLDMGKTLASPVTSPAVQFQGAKAVPYLAVLAGRRNGDDNE